MYFLCKANKILFSAVHNKIMTFSWDSNNITGIYIVMYIYFWYTFVTVHIFARFDSKTFQSFFIYNRCGVFSD